MKKATGILKIVVATATIVINCIVIANEYVEMKKKEEE